MVWAELLVWRNITYHCYLTVDIFVAQLNLVLVFHHHFPSSLWGNIRTSSESERKQSERACVNKLFLTSCSSDGIRREVWLLFNSSNLLKSNLINKSVNQFWVSAKSNKKTECILFENDNLQTQIYLFNKPKLVYKRVKAYVSEICWFITNLSNAAVQFLHNINMWPRSKVLCVQ